jgi:hypothetical protein
MGIFLPLFLPISAQLSLFQKTCGTHSPYLNFVY